MSDSLDDAIPLAGDDDRVYSKPGIVSKNYTIFLETYGEPEKVSQLEDTKLLACAKQALALKKYFKEKYDPILTIIESAEQLAVAAKNGLANVKAKIAGGLEKSSESILDVAVATLESKIQGANTAQAAAICAQVAKAAIETVKKQPAKYGQLKGANDADKQAVASGLESVLEAFLKIEIAARRECGAENLQKLGYTESGAYAAKIERRANVMSKLKIDTENSLGWHNQEISFWIKRAGEALKGKDALIVQLSDDEKSMLGLAPPQSKIRFTGGASSAKWTVGKPTWDGKASGSGGFDVDDQKAR